VRVIAATNRDLAREVDRGRFRADLFHRLAVFPVHVPPLRDRRNDIAVLASHFADMVARRLGAHRVRLDADAHRELATADWPGNVRELENVVSRAVLRATSGARAARLRPRVRYRAEAIAVDAVGNRSKPARLRLSARAAMRLRPRR